MIACSSSDRPGASVGVTGEDASTVERSTVADGSSDQKSPEGGADATADGALSDDGACLDDKPAPTLDGGFKGANDAGVPICPATGTCVTHCENVVANHKLGVAQVAVTCILQLPSCANVVDVNLCVDNALGASCKDTTSPAYCASLVKPCDPNAGAPGTLIDEPGCESIANGLSASGRNALATCIKGKIDAGTCPNEVVQCTNQLRQ